MFGLKCALIFISACFSVAAQDPVNSSDQPASTPASGWNTGPVEISGYVDAYYSLGFNHPSDHVNLLRTFDAKANQLDLNLAKVTLDHAPAPFGFQLQIGAGRVLDIIGAAEKDLPATRYLEEAYFSAKPESWHGVQLDLGKFASSAGAETLDTADNWNYSRSFLSGATPNYHAGLRTTIPLGNQFAGGFQWVGGWNNVVTGATYRTIGVTGSWTRSKFTWSADYYGGPDENTSDRGMRRLFDTSLVLSPNTRAKFYINFDYCHDQPQVARSFVWSGVAGAARFQLSKRFTISQRLEFLYDGSGAVTGAPQTVKEVTLTGTYAVWRGVLNYLEFRRDWSDKPCLGNCTQGRDWSNQPTLLFGAVFLIRPGR